MKLLYVGTGGDGPWRPETRPESVEVEAVSGDDIDAEEIAEGGFDCVVVEGDAVDAGAVYGTIREASATTPVVCYASDPGDEVVRDLAADAAGSYVTRNGTAGEHALADRVRGFGDATGGASDELAAVMNRVTDGFFGLDTDWQFTYLNDRAEELLQRTREELIGESVWDAFAPAINSTFQTEYERAMERQESVSFREYYPPLETWFEVQAYPSETGLSVYFRDVTRNKQAEDGLRTMEAVTSRLADCDEFETGVDAAVSAVVEHTDWGYGEAWLPDGDRLVRADGWSHDPVEIVAEMAATEDARGDAAPVARGEGLPGRAWAEGDPVTGALADRSLETAVAVPVTNDGETLAVLLFGLHIVRENVDRLTETAETAAGELAAFADRLAERRERLRRERQFEAAFEDPAANVLLLDAEGRIRQTNENARENLSPSTAWEGLPYWEHPWWESADTGPDDVRGLIDRVQEGEYVRFETTNEEFYEDRVALDVSIRPVFGDDDEVVGMVVEARDVSQRYRLERRLREERNLNRRILETSPVGIAIVDADGSFDYANDRTVELLGERPERIDRVDFVDADGDPLADDDHVSRRAASLNAPVLGKEIGVVGEDGTRWLSVNAVPLGEDDDRVLVTLENVSAQRERASLLADLADAMGALPDRETKRDVATAAVEAATEALGVDTVAVALYDDGDLTLVPGSSPELEHLVDGPETGSPAWRAFLDHEWLVEDGVAACPLEDEGVLLADVGDAPDEMTVQSLSLLVANVTSELARADREESLREQRATLADRTDELERVNGVNRVIRGLTGRLVEATSREEVEAAVCDSFTDAEPFVMAWIGRNDPTTGEVTPSASAGENTDFLEEITVTADDGPEGRGPTGRAFRTGEVQVQNDLYRDDAFEPWRKEALRRGFRAAVAVPLVYRDTTYGVLGLYATDPNVVGDLEREVLGELGETIAYAINAQERRKALVGDSFVELELRTPLEASPLGAVVPRGAEVQFDDLVPRSDGRFHLFFTATGVDPDAILGNAESAETVESIRLIDDDEGTVRFEARFAPATLGGRLLERGFVPQPVGVEDGEIVVTVRLPTDVDPRSVMEMFDEDDRPAELVAKREVAESPKSRRHFEQAYMDALTDRQTEVLRTTYSAGFFEWPRVSSGQDVADIIGVSQPTVNRHHRTAERKLFGLLFDEE